MVDLRPYQQAESSFLKDHPFSAIWTDAGLGKTRTLLTAAQEPIVVVAPAAVRDTKVWPNEAARVGNEVASVVSYHEITKLQRSGRITDLGDLVQGGTLILDESQNAKEQGTGWFPGLEYLGKRALRMHESTGTPFPNSPNELWGQFHLMYSDEYDFRYKWPWMGKWFEVLPNRHNARARDVGRALLGCRHSPQEAEHCEHWQAFHDANIEGRSIRHLRDDVLPDLPPLSGQDDPLWTPMDPLQARVYKGLKKDLLAMIPEEGIAIEAMTQSHQFSMLQQLSTGLSVLDPDADPDDKHWGKFKAFAESLSTRKRPTLAALWYRNTAAAVARICERQGKSYVMMGSRTSRKQREHAVADFGKGNYDVMIASIGVIKEGVDGLQRGSDETHLIERSWRFGDNEQTIRRLHRLGQEYPVTVRQWVTPKSADSYQWGVLEDKELDNRLALRRVELANLI